MLFVIMLANVQTFVEKRRDKRTYFMKSVARSLIEPYAQQRLHAKQTPKQVRIIIESCGMKPEDHTADTPDAHTAE